MEYLEINHSEVEGIVCISGSKNIALPIICASLLEKGQYLFSNIPDIKDIRVLLTIFSYLNVNTRFKDNNLFIDTSNLLIKEIPFSLIRKFRAAYYLLGVILSQVDSYVFTYPGGCSFQSRPIDYHLEAFKKLGFNIEIKDDLISFYKERDAEKIISFPKPSVGATINVLLYASKEQKEIIIENPSLDYEVKEVISYLNKLGAFIQIEDGKIHIFGNKLLTPMNYLIPYDRIECGTYMLLGLMNGKLLILGVNYYANKALFNLFDLLGVVYKYSNESVIVNKFIPNKSIKITLSSDPFLHTDLGPLLCVFFSLGKKIVVIEDLIYEERNSYVNELNKLGLKIKVINNKIIIFPYSKFKEASLYGKDLRGSMSLLLGAISSGKKIKLYGGEYIERGYENYLSKLTSINVKIDKYDE